MPSSVNSGGPVRVGQVLPAAAGPSPSSTASGEPRVPAAGPRIFVVGPSGRATAHSLRASALRTGPVGRTSSPGAVSPASAAGDPREPIIGKAGESGMFEGGQMGQFLHLSFSDLLHAIMAGVEDTMARAVGDGSRLGTDDKQKYGFWRSGQDHLSNVLNGYDTLCSTPGRVGSSFSKDGSESKPGPFPRAENTSPAEPRHVDGGTHGVAWEPSFESLHSHIKSLERKLTELMLNQIESAARLLQCCSEIAVRSL